jgi:hypothetical protein
MSNLSNDNFKKAKEYWQSNQPLKVGELIFENLSIDIRPRWALTILESIVKRTKIKSVPIEHIIEIAKQPEKWKEAHGAFDKLRESTLKLEKLKVRSIEQDLLLCHVLLAENVAKVIYNSTNPPDEFDEDSGWWIVPCVKDIIDVLNDDAFAQSMWSVLCSNGL